MSARLFSSAEWLKVDNNRGFGSLPIPSSRDLEITKLIEEWMNLDASARRLSSAGILTEQRFTLLGYSERMASLAVRDRNVDLIVLGLIALGLDGWKLDWRDNAVLIALHYDAAQTIGSDPCVLFEKAAIFLADKPAMALRSFLKRSPADRSLAAMGYTAVSDTNGLKYVRNW